MLQGISLAAALAVVGGAGVLVLYPVLRYLWWLELNDRGFEFLNKLNWAALSEEGWPLYSWVAFAIAGADIAAGIVIGPLEMLSRLLLFALALALVCLALWCRRQFKIYKKVPVDSWSEIGDKWRERVKNWRGLVALVATTVVVGLALEQVHKYVNYNPEWPHAALVVVSACTLTPVAYVIFWVVDWICFRSSLMGKDGLPLGWFRWLLPTAEDDSKIADDKVAEVVSFVLSGLALLLGVLAWLKWRDLPWDFHVVLYRTMLELLVVAIAIDIAYFVHDSSGTESYLMPIEGTRVGHLALFVLMVCDIAFDAGTKVLHHSSDYTPAPNPSPGSGHFGGILEAALVVLGIIWAAKWIGKHIPGWLKRKGRKK